MCWDEDRQRCEEAGIPDDLHHRPKWRIALEQFNRAVANGLHFDWLTFDEAYGAAGEFLAGLGKQLYVGEVPCSWWCFTRPQDAEHPSRADDLVRYSPRFNQQPWREIRLQRQTLGEQVWKYKAAPYGRLRGVRRGANRAGLVVVYEPTGEEKYFVSNAAENASVELLIRVGFRRWNVEHAIRLGKQEIGLKHFEGENYTALMRHLTLCLLMMGFVAEQAARLRGEKSGGDGRAGVRGAQRGAAAVAGAAAESHEVAYKSMVIQYHQRRNRAARESRQRHGEGCLMRAKEEHTPAGGEAGVRRAIHRSAWWLLQCETTASW